MIDLEKEKKAKRLSADDTDASIRDAKKIEKDGRRLSAPAIVFLTLASVFLAAFLGYHGYMFVKSNDIKTEVAFPDTAEVCLNVKMFVVRDEKILTSAGGTNVVSAVKDGTRVGVNDTVAYSFADSTSAGNVLRMNEIKDLLEYYNGLNKESTHVVNDTALLDERIMAGLNDFSAMVTSGDFSNLSAEQTEMRDAITSKQTATGVKLDLSSTIEALNREYTQLSSTTSGYSEIRSDGTGYYISGTDGCENTLDYDSYEDWSVQDVENAIASIPEEGAGSRLVHGYYWYMTCLIERDNMSLVKEGSYYMISFPDSAIDAVRTELVSLRYDDKAEKAVAVFRCLIMNEELASLRCENARISVKQYSGFRVKNSAVRGNENNELGVYIVRGSKMLFRKVNVLYTADEYCIVENALENDVLTQEGLADDYISRYDEYIVEGRDLSHGKIIDS